jgi:dTDP-4-dehydrorhamnose reductase
LGLKAIRYPVLWEHVAPESLDQPNWQWPDERLNRLRELGVEPIVGLVHHGSGPRYTSLADPNFATGLARYAGMVAERYPWVRYYTPVNEPLTTARFSGLYGIWYPHGTDNVTFLRLLYNQLLATKLAMKAIRRVNPDALLVQTEDLGQAHSTPALAAQAKFENNRRWLTFDILTGAVNSKHPMWRFLRKNGLSAAELKEFYTDPLPPDILGINYYATSERFLDQRVHHYPGRAVAPAKGNRPSYVDIEALRVSCAPISGIEGLLGEVWSRYGRAIAVTESHLCCTREEQMRWLQEAWEVTNRLRDSGMDLRGLTVWSLLGAFDWNSLLTLEGAFYESGVFDVRGGQPRPTALFKMVQNLALHGHHDHPVLQGPGWWQRDMRFHYYPS